MTARDVIRRLDDLRPNSLPEADKLAQIAELEERIIRDLYPGRDFGGITEDSELTAEGFRGMYYIWLCATLDFEGGDAARRADDMVAFNAIYREYANSVIRSRADGGKLKVGVEYVR